MKVEATGAADYPTGAIRRIDAVLEVLPAAQMFLMGAFVMLVAGAMAFQYVVVQPVWGYEEPGWVTAGTQVMLLVSLVPAAAAAAAGSAETHLKKVRKAATALRYTPGADITVDAPQEA